MHRLDLGHHPFQTAVSGPTLHSGGQRFPRPAQAVSDLRYCKCKGTVSASRLFCYSSNLEASRWFTSGGAEIHQSGYSMGQTSCSRPRSAMLNYWHWCQL